MTPPNSRTTKSAPSQKRALGQWSIPLVTSLKTIETALSEGEIFGTVATLYENERPLHGLAGRLDFFLKGQISQSLLEGSFLGKAFDPGSPQNTGDCVWIPISHSQKTQMIALIGMGHAEKFGERLKVSPKILHMVSKTFLSLKIKNLGLVPSDLGYDNLKEVQNYFEGHTLWTEDAQ